MVTAKVEIANPIRATTTTVTAEAEEFTTLDMTEVADVTLEVTTHVTILLMDVVENVLLILTILILVATTLAYLIQIPNIPQTTVNHRAITGMPIAVTQMTQVHIKDTTKLLSKAKQLTTNTARTHINGTTKTTKIAQAHIKETTKLLSKATVKGLTKPAIIKSTPNKVTIKVTTKVTIKVTIKVTTKAKTIGSPKAIKIG